MEPSQLGIGQSRVIVLYWGYGYIKLCISQFADTTSRCHTIRQGIHSDKAFGTRLWRKPGATSLKGYEHHHSVESRNSSTQVEYATVCHESALAAPLARGSARTTHHDPSLPCFKRRATATTPSEDGSCLAVSIRWSYTHLSLTLRAL